ncbi:MAG: hypothetical protein IT372_19805 [Polyangiaceae bacterium]|nr:hypothetical protein [Polyangiaceae bacterium]
MSSLGAALAALAAAGEVRADGFATPPPYDRGGGFVATSRSERYSHIEDLDAPPRASLVRILVGPAGKLDSDSASPGLLAAVDFGRGPTGFRLTAAWLDVGADHGLSQYTGELTLDFGGRSRFRPTIGAGGGVARTSSSVREDGTLDTSHGATLGLGLLRAGLAYRVPFEDADARVGLDLTGTIPAIRTDSAPDLTPWLLASLYVGIGF